MISNAIWILYSGPINIYASAQLSAEVGGPVTVPKNAIESVANRNESGTIAKGNVGAAGVTSGDEGCVMLLHDEAHLSASGKVGSVLARSQFTIYCSEEQFQLSHPDDNTGWSF